MTEEVLSITEVLIKAANTFLVQQDDEIETPVLKHQGRTIMRLRGKLANNRPASISVSEDDWGMLGVALNVPGNGGLGNLFRILAEDATEYRVDRHLEYMLAQHEYSLGKFTGEPSVY